LKIYIKFCGGCNPRYDRVETLKYIKGELENRAEFISQDYRDADMVLAIMGCETGCADIRCFTGKTVIPILSREQAESFVRDFIRGSLVYINRAPVKSR